MDKKHVPIFTSTSFAAKLVPQVASSKQTNLLFSYLRIYQQSTQHEDYVYSPMQYHE